MVTLFGSSAWAASIAVRARSKGVDIVTVAQVGGKNLGGNARCCDGCARVL
jgi:hypothetical protein